MLIQQTEFQLSEYSSLYDLIVPKDNLRRKINDLIDFSFVYDELVSKYCHTNGRTAESPVRMFKYFLDMSPQDDVINSSSLTKFRKLRLKIMTC